MKLKKKLQIIFSIIWNRKLIKSKTWLLWLSIKKPKGIHTNNYFEVNTIVKTIITIFFNFLKKLMLMLDTTNQKMKELNVKETTISAILESKCDSSMQNGLLSYFTITQKWHSFSRKTGLKSATSVCVHFFSNPPF